MRGQIFKTLWKYTAVADQKRIRAQTPTPGIRTYPDIPYANDEKWQHTLDIYRREDAAAAQPVIIDIHGGGWMYGTKEINKNYCLVLASYGYTVVNINYHLAPEAGVDTQIRDCLLAFQWVEKNIAQFGGNPGEIFLTGDSAGGFLAAHTALVNTSPQLQEIYATDGSGLNFRAVGLTSPVCSMDCAGIQRFYYGYILGKDYKSSPFYGMVNFDRAITMGKMPPAFIVTSSGDYIARNAAWQAYRTLKLHDIPGQIIDWKKTDGRHLPHVFSVTNPYDKPGVETIEAMLAFFRRHATVKNTK